MKKLLTLFFILFSVGVLSAQNLNFKDTTALKTLLCSHAWIRYYLNPDSTFTYRIMDSIVFYKNGTYFESARPADDTAPNFLLYQITKGTWKIGGTARVSRDDTATNCVNIDMVQHTRSSDGFGYFSCNLVDGHRVNGIRYGKMLVKSDMPFIANAWASSWNNYWIWQPYRQPKKSKKHK